VLDSRRLGKQRVETLQVMQVLLGLRWDNARGVIEQYTPKGWRTHPVVLMWTGFEAVLGDYQQAVCTEWERRGFNDTCNAKTVGLLRESGLVRSVDLPPWLGQTALHLSHQSNLIRKDPDWYGPRFPGVSADLPYHWPVRVGEGDRAHAR
jgi:Pyrimidine dimer DNA glycosylase